MSTRGSYSIVTIDRDARRRIPTSAVILFAVVLGCGGGSGGGTGTAGSGSGGSAGTGAAGTTGGRNRRNNRRWRTRRLCGRLYDRTELLWRRLRESAERSVQLWRLR